MFRSSFRSLVGVSFSVAVLTQFALGSARAADPISRAELQRMGAAVAELREKTLASTDAAGDLKAAASALAQGDRVTAAQKLRSWKQRNSSLRRLSPQELAQIRKQALRDLAQRDRVGTSRWVRGMMARLQQAHLQMAQAERKIRQGEFIPAHLSPLRNAAIDRSVARVEQVFRDAYARAHNSSSTELGEFLVQKRQLQVLLTHYYDALLNRMSTVEIHADIIADAMDGFYRTQRFRIDGARLSDCFERELSEQKLRIYVNRRTVSAVGLSAALVAEAIAIPFSGGTSAAAMPATVAAIQTTLTVSSITVGVGTSTLGILDRVQAEGPAALLTLETALDTVSIVLSLRSLGGVTGLTAGHQSPKWVELTLKGVGEAQFLYYTGMDIWTFVRADLVAKEQGRHANEVRRDAAVGLITSMLFRLTGAMQRDEAPGSTQQS